MTSRFTARDHLEYDLGYLRYIQARQDIRPNYVLNLRSILFGEPFPDNTKLSSTPPIPVTKAELEKFYQDEIQRLRVFEEEESKKKHQPVIVVEEESKQGHQPMMIEEETSTVEFILNEIQTRAEYNQDKWLYTCYTRKAPYSLSTNYYSDAVKERVRRDLEQRFPKVDIDIQHCNEKHYWNICLYY